MKIEAKEGKRVKSCTKNENCRCPSYLFEDFWSFMGPQGFLKSSKNVKKTCQENSWVADLVWEVFFFRFWRSNDKKWGKQLFWNLLIVKQVYVINHVVFWMFTYFMIYISYLHCSLNMQLSINYENYNNWSFLAMLHDLHHKQLKFNSVQIHICKMDIKQLNIIDN